MKSTIVVPIILKLTITLSETFRQDREYSQVQQPQNLFIKFWITLCDEQIFELILHSVQWHWHCHCSHMIQEDVLYTSSIFGHALVFDSVWRVSMHIRYSVFVFRWPKSVRFTEWVTLPPRVRAHDPQFSFSPSPYFLPTPSCNTSHHLYPSSGFLCYNKRKPFLLDLIRNVLPRSLF
jgi:hypothetical protein